DGHVARLGAHVDGREGLQRGAALRRRLDGLAAVLFADERSDLGPGDACHSRLPSFSPAEVRPRGSRYPCRSSRRAAAARPFSPSLAGFPGGVAVRVTGGLVMRELSTWKCSSSSSLVDPRSASTGMSD